MLILALDTTSRGGSYAVARDGVVLREESGDGTRAQAVRLPGELLALVERVGIRLDEIDAFAVATGPGSFTGLRIGIASMQGLAFAEHKPLIGISALDALADQASDKSRVATWIDAWRGDVYAALYGTGLAVEEPVVAPPADLLRDMGPGPTTFIGDGAATYRELIVATLGDAARLADPPAPPLAGTIARLASTAYAAGHRPPPHAIRPLYVRRSDAELAKQRQ